MDTPRSFRIVIIHAALLMVGYISIRYSLTLFLEEYHLSTSKCFTIVTSAFALQVLCGFFWGYVLQFTKNPSHDRLAVYGGILAIGGIFTMSFFQANYYIIITGISMYIIGMGLYQINFSSLVCAHADNEETRTKYNQAAFICLNSGALMGLFSGAWVLNLVSDWFPTARYPLLFVISAIAIALALRVLSSHKKYILKIQDKRTHIPLNNSLWIAVIAAIMVMISFVMLLFPTIARLLTIGTFVVFYGWTCLSGRLNRASTIKLLVVTSANLGYRISIVVLYVSFSVYINNTSTVLDHFGANLPGLFFYMFDPVANLLVGTVMLHVLKGKFKRTDHQTFVGIFLLGIAFIIPLFGTTLTGSAVTLPAFFIVTTIMLFGAGEYLLYPAINAQMSNFANEDKGKMRYYTGLNSLGSATGLVIGFYLISTTVPTAYHHALFNNVQLYTFQALLLLIIFATMGVFLLLQRLQKRTLSYG